MFSLPGCFLGCREKNPNYTMQKTTTLTKVNINKEETAGVLLEITRA